MSPPRKSNSPPPVGNAYGAGRANGGLGLSRRKLPAASRPGDDLLARIEAYCAATGTKETVIGRLLFRHDGFVALLRLRGTLSGGKRIAVEQLLAEHPRGLEGVELPDQRLKEPVRKASKIIKSAGQRDRHMDADHITDLRDQADEARSKRGPGESIADRFRRLANEADEEEQAALAEAEAIERRERDLERLPSPSAVLRRAQRDWPDQCRDVGAIAAELGISLGECWRRVIKAGVDCLREGGDEAVRT